MRMNTRAKEDAVTNTEEYGIDQVRDESRNGSAPAQTGHRFDRSARVPWAAVIVFVVVAFGLAWLVALPLWLGVLPQDTTGALLTQGLVTAMMFTPALAMLVVVFIMRAPRTHRSRLLGLWPLRPAKRVVWFIVGGLVGPIVVIVASLAVAAAFGWITLDLENFSGFQAALDAQGAGGLVDAKALVALQLAMIPLGAIFNMIPAFGEEIGWRGWLVPALRPLGVWPALIASGAIWGLWHTPVILLGHNYGFTDWRGVALMILGCIAWGLLFGWARLRSASVWPAVIGHGSLNAAAGLFAIVAAAGEPPALWLVNPLGISGVIVVAIAVAVLLVSGQFGKEPELTRPTR